MCTQCNVTEWQPFTKAACSFQTGHRFPVQIADTQSHCMGLKQEENGSCTRSAERKKWGEDGLLQLFPNSLAGLNQSFSLSLSPFAPGFTAALLRRKGSTDNGLFFPGFILESAHPTSIKILAVTNTQEKKITEDGQFSLF